MSVAEFIVRGLDLELPEKLDGLLARAVVEIATGGRLLSDQKDGYWIPLPLKMLWQSDNAIRFGPRLYFIRLVIALTIHTSDINATRAAGCTIGKSLRCELGPGWIEECQRQPWCVTS